MCKWNSRAQEGLLGRMIQEPQAWQPELATGEGLGADPPECHPTAPAGNQGGCWRLGKLCRGMGTAEGPGGLLRALHTHLDICSWRRISYFAIYSFVWANFGTLGGLSFLETFYSFTEFGYFLFMENPLETKEWCFFAFV